MRSKMAHIDRFIYEPDSNIKRFSMASYTKEAFLYRLKAVKLKAKSINAEEAKMMLLTGIELRVNQFMPSGVIAAIDSEGQIIRLYTI
jgi:hypothetical protein